MRKALLLAVMCLVSCVPKHVTMESVRAVLGEPCSSRAYGTLTLTVHCLGPDGRATVCADDPAMCPGGLLVVAYEGKDEVGYSVVTPGASL